MLEVRRRKWMKLEVDSIRTKGNDSKKMFAYEISKDEWKRKKKLSEVSKTK